MEQTLSSERVMVRYLLGELSVEERAALEAEYFTNSEKFNWLQATEFDLIEGYVNGKLSTVDRARFERNYLTSPVGREKVQFFQTLTKHLSARSVNLYQEEGRAWWQSCVDYFRRPKLSALIFAAAMVILVGGVMLLVIDTVGLHRQLGQVSGERADLQYRQEALVQQIREHDDYRDKLTRDLQDVQQKYNSLSSQMIRTMPATVSFSWTIREVRGAHKDETVLRSLVIPSGTDSVRLVFNRRTNSNLNYRVALLTLNGEEIWSRGSLNARRLKSGVTFELKVPASEFQKGTYRLVISENSAPGETVEIREYHLEVVPR